MGQLEERKDNELSTIMSYKTYIMPPNSEDCQGGDVHKARHLTRANETLPCRKQLFPSLKV
jgi:hypothetical protein